MKNNNSSKAHKVNATSNAAKGFKTFANQQHKSLSACLRAVREALTCKEFASEEDRACVKEFRAILKRDDIKFSDITPAYFVKHLDGGKFCQGGRLGRMVKQENGEKVFLEWENWTPARVVTYLCRANAAGWRAYNAAVREAKKNSLNK